MITLEQDNSLRWSGFEKGIAESPHLGNADMRNVNISSYPGSVAVNFDTTALSKPPTVSALAFTVDTTTNVFTVSATTNWYNGMAIELNSVVTSTGISTGRVYWVGDLTATTFKLYVNPSLGAGAVVDVTGSNGSGTLSSYVLGAPLDWTKFDSPSGAAIRSYLFILDSNGRVWWIKNTGGTLTNFLVYLGNDTLTGTTGRGIAIWQGQIVVFRTEAVDALGVARLEATTDLDGGSGWDYSWDTVSSVSENPRPTLVGQDDILYFGNDTRVGSFSEDTTFDPTDTNSFTKNSAALDLPTGEDVLSLGELGTDLLVGGRREFVYPWDRISASYRFPITLPEKKTVKIVSANLVAFLFSGSEGRIYVTSGSAVQEFIKLPDYVTGQYAPYFTWKNALIHRNQLYFSVTATKNDTTALETVGGVWAVDMKTKALRLAHQLSYGDYGGSANVILPHTLADAPAGSGLYVGWADGSTYGVDITSTAVYSAWEAYIDSPYVKVGDTLQGRTFGRAQFVLDRKLDADQGVRLSYRYGLDEDWTLVATCAGSDANFVDRVAFETSAQIPPAINLQLRVELDGGALTPLLKEVILI